MPCTHQAAGSTPVISTILGRLAQLGERLVYTERVGGSSPSPPTIIGVWRSLASAPALGAGGRRFESYYSDHYSSILGTLMDKTTRRRITDLQKKNADLRALVDTLQIALKRAHNVLENTDDYDYVFAQSARWAMNEKL